MANVGALEAWGLSVGETLVVGAADTEGEREGRADIDGRMVGVSEGDPDGIEETLGGKEGARLGTIVGVADTVGLGVTVGVSDGAKVTEGACDGA